MAQNELDALEIGSKPIAANGGADKVHANHVPQRAQQNEEDELKALEQMMA
jgi:hypothetical protein